MEICQNCNTCIGDIETPNVWRDQVVCNECHTRLSNHGRGGIRWSVWIVLVLLIIIAGASVTGVTLYVRTERMRREAEATEKEEKMEADAFTRRWSDYFDHRASETKTLALQLETEEIGLQGFSLEEARIRHRSQLRRRDTDNDFLLQYAKRGLEPDEAMARIDQLHKEYQESKKTGP